MAKKKSAVVAPVDPAVFPRYTGSATFARLPSIGDVREFDVALLGVPFDGGTSYRPGARFGPMAVRQASRHLRPAYHADLDVAPFNVMQVVDAGDVPCTPFSIDQALDQIDESVSRLLGDGRRVLAIGGDHTISLAMLRAVRRVHGPVALLHFDSHLDTWDSYFGADRTHGTFLRRAFEEGLLVEDHSIHVGVRGPLYSPQDLVDDSRFGFQVIRCGDFDTLGADGVVQRIRDRVGDAPLYVSIDIDVLDPAFAPGTGTPEVGGFTSRELLHMIRGLVGIPIVSGDIVEVSPAYDHAEITALAAATIAYDLLSVIAKSI